MEYPRLWCSYCEPLECTLDSFQVLFMRFESNNRNKDIFSYVFSPIHFFHLQHHSLINLSLPLSVSLSQYPTSQVANTVHKPVLAPWSFACHKMAKDERFQANSRSFPIFNWFCTCELLNKSLFQYAFIFSINYNGYLKMNDINKKWTTATYDLRLAWFWWEMDWEVGTQYTTEDLWRGEHAAMGSYLSLKLCKDMQNNVFDAIYECVCPWIALKSKTIGLKSVKMGLFVTFLQSLSVILSETVQGHAKYCLWCYLSNGAC